MKKKSDIGTMLKEAGILFVITLLSGLMLGFVYELTKEPIAEQERKAVQEACAAVFGEADSFVPLQYVPSPEIQEELAASGVVIGVVYQAQDADGSLLGYCIESVSKRGYGGRIVLYVGISLDGRLKDVSILEISETPGLGMRAEQVLNSQFHDKKADSFVYTKTGAAADNEIDAISGATVTTRAYTNAVNGALRAAADLGVNPQGGDRQ